jgi:hypothetical protein
VEHQGEANVGSPTFSTLHGFVFTTPGNGITMNGIALDSSVQGVTPDIDVGLVTTIRSSATAGTARSCRKW